MKDAKDVPKTATCPARQMMKALLWLTCASPGCAAGALPNRLLDGPREQSLLVSGVEIPDTEDMARETEPEIEDGLWKHIGADVAATPKALSHDTRETFSSRDVWIPLAVVGAISTVLETSGNEDAGLGSTVLSQDASNALDAYGNGLLLFAGAGAWYLSSYYRDDPSGQQASKLLFRSLTLTGLTTVLVKVAINDKRPNGSSLDFPSGHASMSMATASTLHGLYGFWRAAPAYALSGLVGLQRLESRNHHLADVLFGWTLGWVIGHSVVEHSTWRGHMNIAPVIDPERDITGLTVSLNF